MNADIKYIYTTVLTKSMIVDAKPWYIKRKFKDLIESHIKFLLYSYNIAKMK